MKNKSIKILNKVLQFGLISFIVFISNNLFAQSFSGYVLNANDSTPIPGVHLIINQTVRATSQSPNGFFQISLSKANQNILFSHISFENQLIKASDSATTIYLKPTVQLLNEIKISAKPYRNIISDKKMYVIDYGFIQNQLLAISINNKKNNESNLVMINLNGDTSKSVEVKNPDLLYQDCYDNFHLLDKSLAQQVFIDSQSIRLIYPTNRKYFENSFNQIVGYFNGNYIVRKNYLDNQIVEFLLINPTDSSIKTLSLIIDEGGLERLSDKGRLQSSSGYTIHDARFEEMAFYSKKDIYTALDSNKIMIFNTINNVLEIYNFDGQSIIEYPITFHQRKDWDKTILKDQTNGKLYTQFTKYGITTIYEIDKNNGTLMNSTTIPGINFAQKIKINDGKIYFLYNDPSNKDYKQLFESPLAHN